MTGDEHLAKVAEVLAGHAWWPGSMNDPLPGCYCGWRCEAFGTKHDQHAAHVTQALAPLLDGFRAEDEARALRAIRVVLDESCHHCGSGPDDDGDHSCPCPNTDSECLTHLEYPVQPTNLRAALAAAEPDAGAR